MEPSPGCRGSVTSRSRKDRGRGLCAALIAGALIAGSDAFSDGFVLRDGRYAGGPVTTLILEKGQLCRWFEDRSVRLSAAQKEQVRADAGVAPSKVSVYDARYGETDCTCHATNVAFLFSAEGLDVPHAFLVSDEEAARRDAEWLEGAPSAAPECPDVSFAEHLERLRAATAAVRAPDPPKPALAGFFSALPSDFGCFERIFGYDEAPGPLYAEPSLHEVLPKLEAAVPKSAYAGKLVGLSVGAKWEADQVGYLHHATRDLLDTDARAFVALLADLGAYSERSVWSFLFGGPHPSNQPLASPVREQVCEASARSCELAREAYECAVAREKETH